jgi:hypothetical protein
VELEVFVFWLFAGHKLSGKTTRLRVDEWFSSFVLFDSCPKLNLIGFASDFRAIFALSLALV